ncbi:MAG: bifunctional diguanylate cyclase/phosphohydrolase [Bacillota bacterium]
MNRKLTRGNIYGHIRKYWPNYLFIASVIYLTSRLMALCQYTIFALCTSILFFLLLLGAKYSLASIPMRYYYSICAFAVFMMTLRYYNIDIFGFNKVATFLIILYAYLMPDIISSNIIGLIVCLQYYSYTGQEPQYYITGIILGSIISSVGYSVIFKLVRHLTKERNKYQAMSITDSLTGTATLNYTIEEGQKYIDQGHGVAVLVVDLDRFKQINDTYGHMIGNRVLIQVAEFLRNELKGLNSILGRLGGDEFVIVVKDYPYGEVGQLGDKLAKAMREKHFKVDPDIDPIKLSFSVGEAYCKPGTFTSVQNLLHKADVDMYRNKYDNQRMNILTEVNLPRLTEEGNQLLYVLAEKDMYTYVHSGYTAQYAAIIAKDLNLSDEMVEALYIAGWLHDVGKTLISCDIIRKSKKLSEGEYSVIKQHVKYGLSILESIKLPKVVLNGIKYHHERWDGSGYPFGLSGDDIPLEARILQIADAFSAMRIKRLYRNPLSKDDALNEIIKNSGTQFDPHIVVVFLDSVKNVA